MAITRCRAQPNMNKINTLFSEISQQTHKFYEEIPIITQIWHRQILIYMHQQPIAPDHGTKYIHVEENPSRYHGGMNDDSQMDGLMD